ncbi:MAG: hypothetical protein KatS3mg011_0722 [Acidimicrobiia bacterium]|nr:MAG: hypothetical protein KatS3mg011_0722 [Acidimicrobiia bacterium]
MAEVGGGDEPVGDPLEHTQLGVGALETAVGSPVGVVEGEDLVSPVEEGADDLVELGEGAVSVAGDEVSQSLVGLLIFLG